VNVRFVEPYGEGLFYCSAREDKGELWRFAGDEGEERLVLSGGGAKRAHPIDADTPLL